MTDDSSVPGVITKYSKVVIVALLVVTVALGYGATQIEQSSSVSQFESDSPEVRALDYIEANFTAGDENVSTVQVIVRNRSGNVLSKRSLVSSLEFQKRIRNTPVINRTLTEENPVTGVSNIVARTAIAQARGGGANGSGQQAGGQAGGGRAAGNATAGQAARRPTPSLDAQIAQLRSMSPAEVERTVAAVFGNGDGNGQGSELALRLMPTDFDPDSPPLKASARSMIVRQRSTGGVVQGPGGPSEAITDAQLRLQELGQRQAGAEYITFGFGIISEEISQSQSDSLALVSPLALAFVLVTLVVAYRDLLDILLGFVGILVVLVWTFGFMGWAGIRFNQVMIAVPVLLIGLSIDYAIHIFMRHREQRYGSDDSTAEAMRVALAGVGVALVWVTATSVIGFLSNLVSALPPIRDFGVVSAFGIAAALVVFGALIPALKIESDALLERFGFDREKRAFGTGGGRLSQALSVGAVGARKAPYVVIGLALLLTLAGAAGASQVDTSFSQEDFLAEDPPGWMENLPEPFKPAEYNAKENLNYVNKNFQRRDSQSQVLIRGDIGTAAGLERIAAIESAAAKTDIAFVLPNGEAAVNGPVRAMRSYAAANPDSEFARTYRGSQTDDDPAPDRNVGAVLDAFAAAAPQEAANLLYRTEDGEYAAARVIISTKGTATTAAVTDATREVAAAGASSETSGVTATATGSQVVNQVVQNDLFDGVIESLVVSLVAVIGFLMVAYRITEGSFTLGAVTLLPVVLSVAWILGTMYLIGIPFNVLTGTITSLTIGLGVAYSIHVSERYKIELERQGNVWDAMDTAVTGTGGALLGSAATTVGGFGTLSIAILPPLQQFGIITGLTIIYAFLASVLVLPTLLVVWTRYVGPDDVGIDEGPTTPDPTVEANPPTGGDE